MDSHSFALAHAQLSCDLKMDHCGFAAVEFGILGEGWMAVGEHSRAAALFELASTSRGTPSGRKEHFRKLRDRALFEIEQVRTYSDCVCTTTQLTIICSR